MTSENDRLNEALEWSDEVVVYDPSTNARREHPQVLAAALRSSQAQAKYLRKTLKRIMTRSANYDTYPVTMAEISELADEALSATENKP